MASGSCGKHEQKASVSSASGPSFRLSQNFHKCYHGNKESMNLYIFSIGLQLNNQPK